MHEGRADCCLLEVADIGGTLCLVTVERTRLSAGRALSVKLGRESSHFLATHVLSFLLQSGLVL